MCQKQISMKTTQEKLNALRQAMRDKGLDAYLVPSHDPHQSEYVAAHWQARAWLTGFDGSAGTVLVTQDEAGVWTDSRYFLQAEEQLEGSGFELRKLTVPHTTQYLDWLKDNLPEGALVGCSGTLYSVAQVRSMERQLRASGLQLQWQHDLVSDIWGNRPALPQQPVFELDQAYAGQSRADKLAAVRSNMEQLDYCLLTALDAIAWLLNIRGEDIECNPVAISYLLLGKTEGHWFIDGNKVPAALRRRVELDGISLHPYHGLTDFLQELPADSRLGYIPAATSMAVYESLDAEQWKKIKDPVSPLKARRNEVERQQLKVAMRKDGVALLRFYRWLEQSLEAGAPLTEYGLGQQLDQFRREQPNYFGESFPAIVGYAANGAIVHYRAAPEASAAIRPEGLLLLDSGGQYLEGTTDITRTVALGPVEEAVKVPYTLVLKGNIALSRAIFPEGATGVQLDTLARAPLWREGLNYGHGTGHGVGHFLNVHEGPQGITPNPKGTRGQTPLLPGMLTSNEPGYYRAGAFGIRIENLELCVERMESEDVKFYGFETQTLFPISADLIERRLLTAEERQWLNEYHARVLEELSPYLGAEEKQWLQERCRAI